METKEVKIGKNKFSGVIRNSKYIELERICKSWENNIKEKVANNNSEIGLRKAQFGALCSIRSHWTVSNTPATIVMPTGTGKSETMLATIVTEKIKKTLIIVPSDLLRKQIYNKAKKLGVLYEIGMLKDSKALFPNVLLLEENFKEINTFKEYIKKSNIIVTTMNLVNYMREEYIEFLSQEVELLVVDEAHHISSKTWSKCKNRFINKKILQFTATPFREDGKKVDGNIIYNFPLSLAQKQGYFKEIEFIAVEEYDTSISDFKIAEKSVEVLKNDINNGYNHILLVRASTVDRAEYLYNRIYKEKYEDLNPVLITHKQKAIEKKQRMEQLNKFQAKIVVCVDMFGEGIDIPNLKIVAIHDKYKSLPITLQFIGRFARDKDGLGNAKVITNIADSSISEALQDLYEKDSDWNQLLPRKSNEYIYKEITNQELINGFYNQNLDDIDLNQIKAKVSMLGYHIEDDKWEYKNWIKVFDEGKCKFSINTNQNIMIVIEPVEDRIEWSRQKNIYNLIWNYYLVYWNKSKNIVFLNASDKSKGLKLLENIFKSKPILIKDEKVFKCLYGIKRLSLGTVGLNSGIDGPVRYKMFAGVDVAEGIAESSKSNCYKSNVFGHGYNGDGRVSIGCSYKGTIWSRWQGSINFWKKWCDETIDKIINPDIDIKEIIEGVLIPKVVDKFPDIHIYRIDWPRELDFISKNNITICNSLGEYNIQDVGLFLEEEQSSNTLKYFYLRNEDFEEKFSIEVSKYGFNIKSCGNVISSIKIGNKNEILYQFLNSNPPILWFVDGASIEGNIFVELKNNELETFMVKDAIIWNWEELGVDITVESQLDKTTKQKKENSIQFNVIKRLKDEGDYSIIFDDDGSGEIADIVAIAEEENDIRIDLFHCKYSHGKKPGSRVADLYEVCGQADKSVYWKQDSVGMIDRMIDREIKRNNPSRFEKGDIDKLNIIKNKLYLHRATLNIYIVQPGVKIDKITEDMKAILSTSYSYCMDTFSVPLRLICS
ncbi:DEAD/DEAH box helicase [Intestinibacter bartlettii]|uniref:DEAD/DEAH box helicase n=1 Tax=Intestinibacter bartlettii TaxID=261299 RepID=UPI00267515AE|nr:DEAD/DEAH box helicase family protein [Intestinibacter bartlettii]